MTIFRNFIFLFPLFLIITCSAFAQAKTYALPKKSATALKEDLVLLQKILEANHPSLYWYTPKDSMDMYFKQSINSITDSLDEVQFKNKVAWVVSKIRCGHTNVRFSKKYAKDAMRFRYPSRIAFQRFRHGCTNANRLEVNQDSRFRIIHDWPHATNNRSAAVLTGSRPAHRSPTLR